MEKQRLEAFTDGVIAIIITIMVLDFKVPKDLILREQLPRNPSGKILKRVLRDQLTS